jgi:hypothetical protein
LTNFISKGFGEGIQKPYIDLDLLTNFISKGFGSIIISSPSLQAKADKEITIDKINK